MVDPAGTGQKPGKER